MSFYSGFDFFFYLFVLLIPAIILGIKGKSLKWYSFILSLFFVLMIYEKTQLFYLFGYVIFAIVLINVYFLLRKKFERNKFIYYNALFLSLLPLLIYKISIFYSMSIFGFLGISYICFRIIQVVIEIYDGIITELDIKQLARFLLFFPSLSSGPIDRSRRFNEDENKKLSREEYLELLGKGIYKIILGMFYKIVLSNVFNNILQMHFVGHYKPLFLIGYAYVYGIYMFFDFAGYSNMAIGTSYILGIKLPENFNKPFLSIDIKDFWNRWHISLSTWFRDFIFSRFMLASTKNKWFKNRLTAASIGLIVNMLVMGIWHGINIWYIVYGLYHGIILAIIEIYQKKSHFFKNNKNKKWYIVLSWFINLNIVMFGFLIFSGYLDGLKEVFFNIFK